MANGHTKQIVAQSEMIKGAMEAAVKAHDDGSFDTLDAIIDATALALYNFTLERGGDMVEVRKYLVEAWRKIS